MAVALTPGISRTASPSQVSKAWASWLPVFSKKAPRLWELMPLARMSTPSSRKGARARTQAARSGLPGAGQQSWEEAEGKP